jgi:hypothetical protein
LREPAENALLTVSLALTDKIAKNVTPLLSYKENTASSNVTMDTKTFPESALNAKTSQELKDALNHPSPPSADPDSSYTIITALKYAPADSCLTQTDNANLAEPLAFNAKRRTAARDAYLLMSSTTSNAYPNVLLVTSMSLVIANLAHKILVTIADLKTENTVPTAKNPWSFPKDIAFLTALLEDSLPVIDAKSAILHALLVLRKAHALLANLNSFSTKDSVRPNAKQEKSLYLTLASLVKTLTA